MIRLIGVYMLASCLTACTVFTGHLGSDAALPKQFVDRQILVTLSENIRDQWSAIDRRIAARHGLTQTGEFPLSSIRVNCLVYRVPEGRSLETVIAAVAREPEVQLVQQNQIFQGIQAGGPDPYATMEYGAKLIGADRAHTLSTGRDVKIAVIDTGADKDHPDLRGRFLKTQNFVEGGDVSFTQDRHGTAVAGIIGARAKDGNGVYGIAPDSAMLAIKSCWYGTTGSAKASCASWTLAKAIDFAINEGVRIINLSLAGPPDALMQSLLETAHQRGIVIVAAAAEDQPQPGFPASLPTVIAALASDPEDHLTLPGWIGQIEVMAAPGVEIISPVPREGYDFLTGSSMATAHISGAVALMLQEKPQLKPDEVRRLLLQTGHGIDPGQGRPLIMRVDACRVLAAIAADPGCD